MEGGPDADRIGTGDDLAMQTKLGDDRMMMLLLHEERKNYD